MTFLSDLVRGYKVYGCQRSEVIKREFAGHDTHGDVTIMATILEAFLYISTYTLSTFEIYRCDVTFIKLRIAGKLP